LKNTPATLQEVRELLSVPELFSPLDRHFGLFIARLAKNHSPAAALAGALVSRSTREGNTCLDLAEYAGKPLPPAPQQEGERLFVCPALSDWTKQLIESGIAIQTGKSTPLVLVDHRLYLRRYWEYENFIAGFIRQRAGTVLQDLDYKRLRRDLQKLFKPIPSQATDWQQIAAIAAANSSFCVISGGPGTGKTSTAARILTLLVSQHKDSTPLRILLAAPTGKAALRLQQAIIETGLVQKGLEPLQAATLHRMLGHIPNSPYFRHHAENPLAADIIVIDEASMVDLPLMAKLMLAVPDSARFILLGDRNQLASVQPGSVLGDICNTEIMTGFSTLFKRIIADITGSAVMPSSVTDKSETASRLQDSFVELVHSYRFGSESSIARLGRAVKDGDGEGALDILHTSADESISWLEIPAPTELEKALQESQLVKNFKTMEQAVEPGPCFSLLENYRLLCGLRQGPFGTARVNQILEELFSREIRNGFANQFPGLGSDGKSSLPVRPIMVTRNDYNLGLFNGDIGIIMPDPVNKKSVQAFFRDDSGMVRTIAPSLLPGHETAFAMTVHKSQGSEFNRLVLILPDRDSPVLTRELLYTAITRAREKVEIWGRKEIFATAVKRKIKRTSGLAQKLWSDR